MSEREEQVRALIARFSDLATEMEKHSNDHIHDELPTNSVAAAVEGVCADRIRALLAQAQPEWVNLEDKYPPSNCVVFTSKGTDVGIGVWTGRYWRNLSGHSMEPDWWQGIQFPQSAEAQAQPAPRSVCYDCGEPFDKCVLGEAQPAPQLGNCRTHDRAHLAPHGRFENCEMWEAQPVADRSELARVPMRAEAARASGAPHLREALEAGHKAMCDAHGTVKFYLEREKNAPANHQEFAREAAEKLRAYEAAIFTMQNALAAVSPAGEGSQK